MIDQQSDEQLKKRLRYLANDLQFPETPEIADAIRSNLTPLRRGVSLGWYAVGLMSLVLILGFTPSARAAMWQLLDTVGIDVRFGDEQGQDTELDLLDSSAFGSPTTLTEAEAAFGQPLQFPTHVLPEEPDAVYLLEQNSGLISVTFVYAATDDIPALHDSNVGAILTQIVAPADSPYLAKTVLPTSGGTHVEMPDGPGYWIENGQLSLEPSGVTRPSANVLIWLDSMVAYRLESLLDMNTSLQIAASLERVTHGNHSVLPIVWGSEVRRTRAGG